MSTRADTRDGSPRSGWAGVLLAFSLVFFFAGRASAQANYEGLQVGGRTAMMGGTAVAAGSDQATVFINPATITRIPERSFSFSTFTAHARIRNLEGALDPSGQLELEDANVNDLGFRIQPNTFCVFLDGPPKDEHSGRSRHKFGICAATTERDELEFTQNEGEGDGELGIGVGAGHSTNFKWVRSSVAFGWALQLDRDTSIGVTARIDNSRLNDQTNAASYAQIGNVGGIRTLDHSIEAWSWDTGIVVGFTHFLSRHVTVGVSLATPSQHLFGSHTGISTTTATADPSTIIQDDGDFRYNHPGSLRMGFGFSWPRLQLGIDASFYGPHRDIARSNFDRARSSFSPDGQVLESELSDVGLERASVSERGKPVTNLGLGLEYFIEPDLSIVGGIQSDFSGLHKRQDTPADEVLFRQKKDAVHVSLGTTTYGEAGRLLVGVRGHYAAGTALIADSSVPDPVFVALPQSEWGLNLVVSGSLTFRAVQQAADKAKQAADKAIPGQKKGKQKGDKEEEE